MVDVCQLLYCECDGVGKIKIKISGFYGAFAKVVYSLFTWSKQKWLFWRAGFFSTSRSLL